MEMVNDGKSVIITWDDEWEEECQWSNSKIYLIGFLGFSITLILTNLVALCNYVYVEKPGIDARKVYKNKYAKSS